MSTVAEYQQAVRALDTLVELTVITSAERESKVADLRLQLAKSLEEKYKNQ